MKKSAGVLLIAIALFSCAGDKKKEMNSSEYNDSTFTNYKEAFVLRLWKMYPVWASSVGYHNCDSILYVPDEAQRKSELDFVNGELDSIKHFKPEKLNDNNRTDYYLIENQLRATAWGITDMKSYEWDPSSYN